MQLYIYILGVSTYIAADSRHPVRGGVRGCRPATPEVKKKLDPFSLSQYKLEHVWDNLKMCTVEKRNAV